MNDQAAPTPTPHGHVHWNELMTRDVEGVQKLYSESMGWTFETMPMPDGDYVIIHAAGQMVGGMFDLTGREGMDDIQPSWMTYIAVDDVDACLAKATALGAMVMGQPFDVPGVGRIAMVRQPDGAMIGWMTPSYEPMAS